MNTYTVKSGDTLFSIANRIYKNPSKWKEIAELNRLGNGASLKVGQVLHLPPKDGVIVPKQNTNISRPQPKVTPTPNPVQPKATETDSVEITNDGSKYYYRLKGSLNTIVLGNIHRNKVGISRIGTNLTERFIRSNESLLRGLKLTNSEIITLSAVSQNEGNLDAINTWDGQFLSWGMFQWTLGGESHPGELPALLKIVQEKKPRLFQDYFGAYGIGISPKTGPITGFITLQGTEINSPTKKQPFRGADWALRFLLAGQNPEIASVQILHAVNRLENFYYRPDRNLGGNSLSQILTSEYAVGLLLDNHVNRPAYVIPCVMQALTSLKINITQALQGDEKLESKIIQAYLKIRETHGPTPMTHAAGRANNVLSYVKAGRLSTKKHSFQSGRNSR